VRRPFKRWQAATRIASVHALLAYVIPCLTRRTTQENIEMACTLARDFDIQRMQRATDAWLTQVIVALCCGSYIFEGRRFDDFLAPLLSLHLFLYDGFYKAVDETVALARVFPFLKTCKEACGAASAILSTFTDESVHVVCEREHESQLEFARDDLLHVQAQLAQLRAAQPYTAFVRCCQDAGAAADAPEDAQTDEKMPFADLRLRAEADGASARVHRGLLAACSPVFETALREAPAGTEEIMLLGKSKAELDLLVAWLYHEHAFTKVRLAVAYQ
jgi:hypothetical protein